MRSWMEIRLLPSRRPPPGTIVVMPRSPCTPCPSVALDGTVTVSVAVPSSATEGQGVHGDRGITTIVPGGGRRDGRSLISIQLRIVHDRHVKGGICLASQNC